MALALFFMVAAFVIYFSFTAPAYDELQRIRAEVVARESLTGTQSKVIKQIKQLISTYQGQLQIQERVSQTFPLEEDIPGALTQIHGLVTGNRLVPQSFQVSSVGGTALPKQQKGADGVRFVKPIGTLTLQVHLTGTYSDLKTLLDSLETNIRIFDVKSLTFRAANKPTQDLYNADLSVATYYQAQ